jgi:acetoin utilization deacetylase AcuC-like enzyme
MATGFIFHELYLWHNTQNWAQIFPPGLDIQPGEHAENPETKRRFRNLIEVSGLMDHLMPLKPRAATKAELARVHTPEHIANIRALSATGYADAGGLTPMGSGSYDIALLAAGGAMVAVDAVLTGKVGNAYALIRPPGHHATRSSAMGFCLFANAAIAIEHARAVHGLKRIAVVDWDVHHGNGTQSIFYADPGVLTISLHQDNLFPPESGRLDETGTGAGLGYNLNLPLPAGSGDGAYLAAMKRVVLPALQRFKPELIVVPCGFDASGMDPLGRQMVSADGFRSMTRLIMQAADTLCAGRLVMTHEGGYSAAYVPYCGLAVLEELSGIPTHIADPWTAMIAGWGGQDLQPHQAIAIDRAVALVSNIS